MKEKSKEEVKKDVEASGISNYIEQFKAMHPNSNLPHSGVCPNCGYCPCCGRPRENFNYPVYPVYPIYPNWTC